MTYRVDITNRMKKDIKLLKKQGKDLSELYNVLKLLAEGKLLPEKYDDHPLKGSWKGYIDCRDCHVENDLVLIYQKKKNVLTICAIAVGSHSYLDLASVKSEARKIQNYNNRCIRSNMIIRRRLVSAVPFGKNKHGIYYEFWFDSDCEGRFANRNDLLDFLDEKIDYYEDLLRDDYSVGGGVVIAYEDGKELAEWDAFSGDLLDVFLDEDERDDYYIDFKFRANKPYSYFSIERK